VTLVSMSGQGTPGAVGALTYSYAINTSAVASSMGAPFTLPHNLTSLASASNGNVHCYLTVPPSAVLRQPAVAVAATVRFPRVAGVQYSLLLRLVPSCPESQWARDFDGACVPCGMHVTLISWHDPI
jgi:hypothetical protein